MIPDDGIWARSEAFWNGHDKCDWQKARLALWHCNCNWHRINQSEMMNVPPCRRSWDFAWIGPLNFIMTSLQSAQGRWVPYFERLSCYASFKRKFVIHRQHWEEMMSYVRTGDWIAWVWSRTNAIWSYRSWCQWRWCRWIAADLDLELMASIVNSLRQQSTLSAKVSFTSCMMINAERRLCLSQLLLFAPSCHRTIVSPLITWSIIKLDCLEDAYSTQHLAVVHAALLKLEMTCAGVQCDAKARRMLSTD